jgi:hypothetical protein
LFIASSISWSEGHIIIIEYIDCKTPQVERHWGGGEKGRERERKREKEKES